MRKYLELFKDGFDSTIAEKTKVENWPYVGYSPSEGIAFTVIPQIPNYLCLEPIDSNNQLALLKLGDYSNIQYSFDKSNWNNFTTDSTNPMNLTYISVDKPIYLRGNNPNGILNQKLSVGCKLFSSGKYNVSGDATTLLNIVGDVRDLTPYGEQSLMTLFGSIPSSVSGLPIDMPCVDIVDASKLILPSITLSNECYLAVFRDCTSLTAAPDLPATTLAKACYAAMFQNCISLETAPELPATTLAEHCYEGIFYGCTSLTTAPELPATTLAEHCYRYMFWDCTSLTTAPELPATTLADYCYYGMFNDCTKLNYIKCLATDISAFNCINIWVLNISQTGTFVKHPDMNNWPTSKSGIPSGWTVIDAEL